MNFIAVILMVRYEVSGFREQGTVAGRSEMMPNFRILLYEKRFSFFSLQKGGFIAVILMVRYEVSGFREQGTENSSWSFRRPPAKVFFRFFKINHFENY
jgi:hypothetical protein